MLLSGNNTTTLYFVLQSTSHKNHLARQNLTNIVHFCKSNTMTLTPSPPAAFQHHIHSFQATQPRTSSSSNILNGSVSARCLRISRYHKRCTQCTQIHSPNTRWPLPRRLNTSTTHLLNALCATGCRHVPILLPILIFLLCIREPPQSWIPGGCGRRWTKQRRVSGSPKLGGTSRS